MPFLAIFRSTARQQLHVGSLAEAMSTLRLWLLRRVSQLAG
jgi:hypothetical protein